MSELKPCPFCGHPRSRLMSRTEYRENAEGLTAIFTEFDFHGFVSGEQEVKMLDFRHAFYRRCNRCGARGPLVKTDWHVRTEEEADDFSFGSKLWPCGPDSEWARPWREKADAEWNRRSGEIYIAELRDLAKNCASLLTVDNLVNNPREFNAAFYMVCNVCDLIRESIEEHRQ